MTVTLDNVDQIADVIRSSRRQGWRMFSFQPAAYVGSENRWREGFRSMTDDDVWTQIELGVGRTLPHSALQWVTAGANAPLGTVKAARIAHPLVRRPHLLAVAAVWAWRFVHRAGGVRTLRQGVVPVTFVMHSIMDAAVVAPAWSSLQRGELSADAQVRAAQEQLQACTYSIAHPDTGEVVPACVQRSVLDRAENLALAQLLPLPTCR